jgi:hypothetical protein
MQPARPTQPSFSMVSLDELAAMLVPTLGQEKAAEVLGAATRKLSLSSRHLDVEQVSAVLALLTQTGGLVGVAARLVQARIGGCSPPSASPTSKEIPGGASGAGAAPPSAVGPRSGPAPGTSRSGSAGGASSLAKGDLVALLSPSMGDEKASEVVSQGLRRAGVSGDTFPRERALLVLEELAKTPGLVGVTARFAKAKLLLRA